MRAGDLEKLKITLEVVPEVEYICLDVANGYSEHFVEFVKQVRKEFPHHTIMVVDCYFFLFVHVFCSAVIVLFVAFLVLLLIVDIEYATVLFNR